jgi:aspartate/methionine/tyrosine aminotransferase
VSPNNPTGAVYPETDLRALNRLCADRGVYHVHDEAYEYFTYGGARHVSPGAFPGAGAHTISLYSLSKACGMAGWRLGYLVAPAALAGAINKIQDTIAICPPIVSQHVALAALGVGATWARAHLDRLDALRRRALATLGDPAVPCDVPAAEGAFYYFLRVYTAMDAMRLAERLIREHRVAVMPGSAFGATTGCAVRLSYGALDDATAAEGIGRLAEGLTRLAGVERSGRAR